MTVPAAYAGRIARVLVAIAGALAMFSMRTAPLAGQDGSPHSFCNASEVQLAGASGACTATAQAAGSAHPLLALLVAGGNPTLGTAGTQRLRLGALPRVSAGVRLNAVGLRLPDVLNGQPGEPGYLTERIGVRAPAVVGELSVSLFPGFQLAPGIGGIGGLSLLGSVGVLPFELFDTEGFGGSDPAFGIGARLHLIDESFQLPAVSLSLIRVSASGIRFGDVCPGGLTGVPSSTNPEIGACASAGDAGEFGLDLTSWSTRLVASKQLFGVGAAVGVGHDSSEGELDFGFRGTEPLEGADLAPAFRIRGTDLDSGRWTAFGNLSFTFLVTSITAEAGWVQGERAVEGFRELASEFDPADGSWYGSLGIRLAL